MSAASACHSVRVLMIRKPSASLIASMDALEKALLVWTLRTCGRSSRMRSSILALAHLARPRPRLARVRWPCSVDGRSQVRPARRSARSRRHRRPPGRGPTLSTGFDQPARATGPARPRTRRRSSRHRRRGPLSERSARGDATSRHRRGDARERHHRPSPRHSPTLALFPRAPTAEPSPSRRRRLPVRSFDSHGQRAPSPPENEPPAGSASNVDHVSTDRPSFTACSPIRRRSRAPIPRRRQSARTNTSHSITRGSPAECDQQNPAATGVPSSVPASQAWSSNCDGKFRANAT